MRMPKYAEPATPVEVERRRRTLRRLVVLAVVALGMIVLVSYRYSPNRPVVYDDIEEHFKYGSIGSDIENGMPLAILKVLPRMFPEHLPDGSPLDLTAFGFVQEPGKDRPIGFSKRRRLVDVVGFNCAVCHVGVVRETEAAEPRTYLGMPANTVNLHAFLNFIFAVGMDDRFTPDNVIVEIQKDEWLDPVERFIYRVAVGELQKAFLRRKAQFDRFLYPSHAEFGPGRVDTFNPYKVDAFAEHYRGYTFPEAERVGTADFPSIWNQGIRDGMELHWDGNNTSVRERNFSAAFGAGATRENVDVAAIDRINVWLKTLPPPRYPFATTSDATVVARGERVFNQSCADCHAIGGRNIGRVTPLADVQTDEYRLNSFTEKLAGIQLTYGKGYEWEFKNFRKTDGYANAPLDGIWARAPYLHNGSVPTLYDLLTPAERRNGGNPSLSTGHGVYDTQNVGFQTTVIRAGGRRSFTLVIADPGNSNKGHSGPRYGTDLSEEEKRALIEYLKTL